MICDHHDLPLVNGYHELVDPEGIEGVAKIPCPLPTRAYRKYPVAERPNLHETSREAQERRRRNIDATAEWSRFVDARCAQCGMVRFHVSHEMDPEHSAEGPEYHAEFPHHPFQERKEIGV